MPELFVIHVDTDDATVTRICEALTAVDAWVDHRECEGPRDNWGPQTQEALQTCQCGLFVLSAQSSSSIDCRDQCQAILDDGKLLIIASIDSVALDDFPEPSPAVQYVDLTRDFEAGISQIISAIKNRFTSALLLFAADPSFDGAVTGPFPAWHLDLPLVGREMELNAILKAFQDGHRVAMLLGWGGVGKTRLAVEIVRRSAFKRGVIWLSIGPFTTLADLTTLIRNRLDLDVGLDQDAVWAMLNKQPVLLVIDNAEECAQRAAYAERLNKIDLSGGTRILLVTRQRWQELRDVKPIEVRPPDVSTAIAMLQEMAKREPPEWSLNGYEEAIVRAACCRPKLLAFALRWADTYPPDYLVRMMSSRRGTDIEQALDDLVGRTLRIIQKDPAWPDAQKALRRLAVTSGSFTFDAAHMLIGDAYHLRLLKEWGLISLNNARYHIDPLLHGTIEPDDTAREIQYNYYLTLADAPEVRQDRLYLTLAMEMENLVAAYEWAITNGHYEKALDLAVACSHFLVQQGHQELHKTWFERLAAKLTNLNHSPPHLLARVNLGLGVAYQERQLGDRRTNLLRAITAFERALRHYMPDKFPHEYANVQNNLGITRRNLAEIEDEVPNLKLAIRDFERALRYYDQKSTPREFAIVYNNLGAAYLHLALNENRKTNLHHAIQAFRKALTYIKEDELPVYYALVQNNIGSSYADMAEVDDPSRRADHLRRAGAAFDRAKRFLTPQCAPMQYARMMHNMAHTHRGLAQLYREPDQLRKAVKAYNSALKIWTPGTAPVYYALTHNRLGHTHLELADMEDAITNLTHAVEAFQQSLKFISSRTNAPEYIKTQVVLGIAYRKLGDQQAAVACWQEAERYFRRMQMNDMADRLNRWITGQSDPGASRNPGNWMWQTRI